MILKLKLWFRNIKKEKRKYLSYLVTFVFLVWVWFYWYNYYMSTTLQNNISKTEEKIEQEEEKYSSLTQEDNYERFETALHIKDNVEKISWQKRISSLIDVFDRVSQIWEGEEVNFEDFAINVENIQLRWDVRHLSTVYQQDWLIDEFKQLDFIQTINIPSYSKRWENYQFNLTSKLKIDD